MTEGEQSFTAFLRDIVFCLELFRVNSATYTATKKRERLPQPLAPTHPMPPHQNSLIGFSHTWRKT